jgi:hypothetical protein
LYSTKGTNMARTTFAGPIAVGKGALSTVTQATDRSTGVTINAPSGRITMNAASLAAGAEAKFTVTNSFVTANSVPVVALASGQTADTSMVFVSAVAAGSFQITVSNLNAATADTGAGVINFIVFNGTPD